MWGGLQIQGVAEGEYCSYSAARKIRITYPDQLLEDNLVDINIRIKVLIFYFQTG